MSVKLTCVTSAQPQLLLSGHRPHHLLMFAADTGGQEDFNSPERTALSVAHALSCRFGIGAIAECGHTTTTIINEAAVEAVGATQQQLQDTIDSERQELRRRVQAYRQGRPHLPVAGTVCACLCRRQSFDKLFGGSPLTHWGMGLTTVLRGHTLTVCCWIVLLWCVCLLLRWSHACAGKVVVLVDDGLATGVTARAAAEAMRVAGAAVVVLAVPVGAAHTVAELQQQRVADFVVCLRTPKHFRAVGAHYQVSPCLATQP